MMWAEGLVQVIDAFLCDGHLDLRNEYQNNYRDDVLHLTNRMCLVIIYLFSIRYPKTAAKTISTCSGPVQY